MKTPLQCRARGALGLAIVALVLTSCGGGHGSPTAPTPGVPLLSNLVANFQGPCNGGTGTTLSFTVDYRDSDGDIRGGTLQTTATAQPSGSSIDLNFGLPSTNVSVSGTTEGQIQALACLRFGNQTGAQFSVAVVDAGGHSSNVVSTQLNRPSGAPETLRGGGTNWSLDRLN